MARLDKSRRHAIRKVIPPKLCSSRTTAGEPCEKDAMVGSDVCYTHGGNAPQVRAAAEKRVSLAEAMVRGVKRQPYEVLEDALHAADLLMRDATFELGERGTVTTATMDKFVAAFERAHRLAKVNLDAGIDQRRLQLAEAQAGQMHKVFTRVMTHPDLGLTAEQKAMVQQLLRREIEGVIVARAEIAA